MKYVSGLFFAISISFLSKTDGESFFNSFPLVKIGGIISGIIFITLVLVSKARKRKTMNGEQTQRLAEDVENDLQFLCDELDVPYDAASVDILNFRYKVKDGEIHPTTYFMQASPYFNVCVRAYASEEELNICDFSSVYTFRKSDLKCITTVNKRILLPMWNKEAGPKSEAYKKYRLAVNQFGHVFSKPYYILEIKKNGEVFGLYFPAYEIEQMEKLTGLKATDN